MSAGREEKRHLLVRMAFRRGIPHCTTARIPLLDRASQRTYLLHFCFSCLPLHEAQLQAMNWPRFFCCSDVEADLDGELYLSN